MKKIICVTGTRAEYGVVEALLKKMQQSGFDVSLIATGMHLSAPHGHTIDEVKKSGLRIIGEVDMHVDDSTNAGMSRAIGHGILGMTDILEREKPDLLIIVADRGEALAGAIAGAHLNIPIAHVSGGDVTTGATIDERIRHAVTKLSDIHFPATEQGAKVVISMGENKELVFAVGNPGLQKRYALGNPEKESLAKKYKLDQSKPILLVVQHPITRESAEAGAQMRVTLTALKELGLQTILVYPNSDAGNEDMIAAIEEGHSWPFMRIHKNIPREDFVGLMSFAGAMVGNSSAALIEAPSFGLPAVNIGTRQEGRERADNVIDAPHEVRAIIAAIQKALSPTFKKSSANIQNPYATGDADARIIAILQELDLSPALLMRKSHPHA